MFRLIYTVLLFAACSIGAFFLREDSHKYDEDPGGLVTSQSPPSLQLYYNIEKYAREEGVPLKYAYGIACTETSYHGPFDWSYDHSLTSSAGAVGPMQVMFATAKSMLPGEEFTKEELRTNIELNVRASMKLLRYLHNRYHDWKVCFGAYNTGTPCINSYAEKVYAFEYNKWK